ncbi:MAG: hypothetical protein GQ525_11425 [Draconibacterium sp.]|nr:hypothetical protein [Draconibacterium sp.]
MNKILIALLIIISISCQIKKKNTNSSRNNQKDSISITVSPQQFIKTLPDKLAENSGIIYYDNLFWTFNDSGGENSIYAFNLQGEIIKEIEIKDAQNDDWEDIAHDKKYIYIGDFGNNRGTRKNQAIYRIKKKEIGKNSKQKIKSKKIKFNYEDQTDYSFKGRTTPFDCEALIEFDEALYIFTKDWANRYTTVYQIPKKNGEYKIKPIDKFNVTGLITGADVSPDKSKLALVGYKDYKPILWIFSDFTAENFWGKKKTYMELDSIFDAQTEGVCFLGNDSILISCESTSTYLPQVFLIDLNDLK